MMRTAPSQPRRKRKSSRRPNNAGFSLLEMLVYIVVFGMAVNLLISLLSTGSRLAATTTLGLARLEGVREVTKVFTEQTRRASYIVERAGEYETGTDRLVLALPPDTETGWDYAVLGRLHDPDKFGVLGLVQGGSGLETVHMTTYRQPLEKLAFTVERNSNRPVVHLDVQIKLEVGERERPFLVHRATAVPRGIGS